MTELGEQEGNAEENIKFQFATFVWKTIGAGRSFAWLKAWLAERRRHYDIRVSAFNNMTKEDDPSLGSPPRRRKKRKTRSRPAKRTAGANWMTFVTACRVVRALWQPAGTFRHTYAELCRTERQRDYLRRVFPFADEIVRDEAWDQSIEEDLKQYCAIQVQLWQDMLDGKNSRHDYTRYEPPRFSRMLDRPNQPNRGPQARSETPSDREYLSDAFVGEDEKFTPLFQLGPRVLVHDDAGGGKTTFSRAVVAWLSRPSTWNRLDFLNKKPCLAMRFERTFAEWPSCLPGESAHDAYLREISRRLRVALRCKKDRATEIAEYAWENGRVVLVMDAFDQVSDKDQREAFQQLTNADDAMVPATDARVLVTSRPHSAKIDPHFMTDAWVRVQLEGFEPWQQLCVLRDEVGKALGETWRQRSEQLRRDAESSAASNKALNEFAAAAFRDRSVFSDVYPQVTELLRVPIIVQFVREMCGDDESGAFPQFVNRADIYWQMTQRLLRTSVKKALVTEGSDEHDLDARVARLRQVLSAVAIHMLFVDERNYRTDDVQGVRKEASGSVPGIDYTQAEWNRIWKDVQNLAGFTNHALLEESTTSRIGWKHRGLMEFYGGLFLALYADTVEQGRLPQHAANPEWFWTFRFAMELTQLKDTEADKAYSPEILARSIEPLFGDVRQVDPKCGRKWRRPTELMYYAYCLITTDKDLRRRDRHVAEWGHPGLLADFGSSILAAFAQSFDAILSSSDPEKRRIARQLAENGVWTQSVSDGPIVSYVDCPPDDIDAAFLVGVEPGKGDKEPFPVQLTPFRLQSTPVTQQQYLLFDAAYRDVEWSAPRRRDVPDDYVACALYEMGESPPSYTNVVDVLYNDVTSAVCTSYYDAFMFSRWVGGRLPTEAEWEFAFEAPGGKRPDIVSFHALRTRESSLFTRYWRSLCCGITGWPDRPVRVRPLVNDLGERIPARRAPSQRLFGMYGVVWQWCSDFFANDLSRCQIEELADGEGTDPLGTELSDERVIRGQSCGYQRGRDWTATRASAKPSSRSDVIAFRIARGREPSRCLRPSV